jgi:hypothetical protein
MLRLAFITQQGASRSVGAFSELRFDRAALRPSPAGSPLAEHREHCWLVEGERYPRLDCEGRVMLHFTDAKGTLGQAWGPFEHLSCVNGVIYANRKKFATFDEASGLWTIEPSGLRCPILVARSPI